MQRTYTPRDKSFSLFWLYYIKTDKNHVFSVFVPGPLPVDSATISDYREAPETGVVFEISSPPNNVFSRVNISYVEGTDLRSMLYKGNRLS